MAASLRIIDGTHAGTSCELRPGQRIILGRGEESDFLVLDSWASRAHAAVSLEPEGVILEDLGSKNGTYVSGQRVSRARLPDGSLIQIGTTTVRVAVAPGRLGPPALPAAFRRRVLRAAAVLSVAALLLVGLVYGGVRLLSSGGQRSAIGKGKRSGGLLDFLRGGPRTTAIDIESEPDGASVFIDDEFVDPTPLRGVELAVGTYSLRVQKRGYEVYRGTLTVGEQPSEPIRIALRIAERGSLEVNSKPEGAAVYLDAEYRGKTPLVLRDLEPQTYSLRLEQHNFADWQQQVEVKPGQNPPIHATLGHREIDFYLTGLKKDPNNVSYHTEVAHLYLLDQKVDPCIQHLASAFEITIAGNDTTQPEPYQARLVWLIQKIYFNDYFNYGDDAFVEEVRRRIDAMFAELAGRHSGSTLILSTAEQLYKRAGTPLRMVDIYLRQAEALPNQLEPYLEAVALLQRAGQYDRAAEAMTKALKANPDNYRVYLTLGRIHLAAKENGVQGAREKAIEALNAALQHCDNEGVKAQIRALLGRASR